METFGQVNALFWVGTFAVLFIFSWILAIAAVWVFFRASRDLHRIADALEGMSNAYGAAPGIPRDPEHSAERLRAAVAECGVDR